MRAGIGRRREPGNFGNSITGHRCQPQVQKLLGRPSLLVQGGLLSVKGKSILQAVPEEVIPREERAHVKQVSREVGIPGSQPWP